MVNIGGYMHAALPPHVQAQLAPGWNDPSVGQMPHYLPAPPAAGPWDEAPGPGAGPWDGPDVNGSDPAGPPPGPYGWPGGVERLERHPLPAPAPGTSGWRPPATDSTRTAPGGARDSSYGTRELVSGGVKGFAMPYAFGGLLTGAFVAGTARAGIGTIAKGGLLGLASGVALGVGTGLAVKATSPDHDSSLGTRFGAAGLALGGVAALARGGSPTGIALGALSGAVVGAFTGRDIQRAHEASAR